LKILYMDLERYDWRGGQSQALLTVRGLRARGHQVELIAVDCRPLAQRTAEVQVPLRPVSSTARQVHGAYVLSRALAATGADLVHANEPHALTAAWLAAANRRAALVASRRIALPLNQNWATRARYRAVTRLFAISQFVAESLVRSGVSPERIRVVHEGVSIPVPVSCQMRAAARRAWNFSAEDFVLGCVAYLLPEKGHELLLRSLPGWLSRQPRCRLLLAGDGPQRRHLEALAAGLGLRERVHFAGVVDRIENVYAALDAFVFPSIAEPLGTSLLSAMAYGLPVVAVASGGVPEFVTHGTNGMLAQQPSADAFAAAMVPLLEDAALRKRLGIRARQDMAERFSDAVMAENTITAYEEALEARRSGIETRAPR
jgi:L-malate glycosyltransferase